MAIGKCKDCKKGIQCKCLHKYSDGSALGGSGTELDPYVYEKPKVDCLKDGYGRELFIDGDKCVILPNYPDIKGSPGASTIIKNADGLVEIKNTGDKQLGSFTVRDSEGTIMTIGNEDYFNIDSDNSSKISNRDNVVIDPAFARTFAIPRLKNLTATSISGDFNTNIGGLTTIGTDTLPTRTKATRYQVSVSVGIKRSAPFTINEIGLGETFESWGFGVELLFGDDSLSTFGTDIVFIGHGRYSQQWGNGYQSFTFKDMFIRDRDSGAPEDILVRTRIRSTTMSSITSKDDIDFDSRMTVSWI